MRARAWVAIVLCLSVCAAAVLVAQPAFAKWEYQYTLTAKSAKSTGHGKASVKVNLWSGGDNGYKYVKYWSLKGDKRSKFVVDAQSDIYQPYKAKRVSASGFAKYVHSHKKLGVQLNWRWKRDSKGHRYRYIIEIQCSSRWYLPD